MAAVIASPPRTAMASAEKAAMKVAFSSKKRKTDEEKEQPDEAEDEDEPDMKWACEITAMRLLKKAKKEHLIPLLEDFGVPTKGSKEELSTLCRSSCTTRPILATTMSSQLTWPSNS